MHTLSPQGRVKERSTVALSVEGTLLMQVGGQNLGPRHRSRGMSRRGTRSRPDRKSNTQKPPNSNQGSQDTEEPAKEEKEKAQPKGRGGAVKGAAQTPQVTRQALNN